MQVVDIRSSTSRTMCDVGQISNSILHRATFYIFKFCFRHTLIPMYTTYDVAMASTTTLAKQAHARSHARYLRCCHGPYYSSGRTGTRSFPETSLFQRLLCRVLPQTGQPVHASSAQRKSMLSLDYFLRGIIDRMGCAAVGVFG